ncbi:unnamed protein product, partial [Meganyctiphanes norvegica]
PGKSLGSLTGGVLMELLNARHTFQIFSGISLFIAFVYYLVLKFILQPLELKRLKRKNEVMNMPIETISTLEHQRSLKRKKKAEQKQKEEIAKKTFKKWRAKTKKAPTPTAENGRIIPDNSLITNVKPTDHDTNENGNISVLDETLIANLNETQTTNLNETQMSSVLADESQVWEDNSENEERVSDMICIENEIIKNEVQTALCEDPMPNEKGDLTLNDEEKCNIVKEEVAPSLIDEPTSTISITNEAQTQSENDNKVEKISLNDNHINYKVVIEELEKNNTAGGNYQSTPIQIENNENINPSISNENVSEKIDAQNNLHEEKSLSIEEEIVVEKKDTHLDETEESYQEPIMPTEKQVVNINEQEISNIPKKEVETSFIEDPKASNGNTSELQTQSEYEDKEELKETNTAENLEQSSTMQVENNENINQSTLEDNLSINLDSQKSFHEDNIILDDKKPIADEKNKTLDEAEKSSQENKCSEEHRSIAEGEGDTNEAVIKSNEDKEKFKETNTVENLKQPSTMQVEDNININQSTSDVNTSTNLDAQKSLHEGNIISDDKKSVVDEKNNTLDETENSSQENKSPEEHRLIADAEREHKESVIKSNNSLDNEKEKITNLKTNEDIPEEKESSTAKNIGISDQIVETLSKKEEDVEKTNKSS